MQATIKNGIFFDDLAKQFTIHPNTVREFLKKKEIPHGLMTGPRGIPRRALTRKDAQEFRRLWREWTKPD